MLATRLNRGPLILIVYHCYFVSTFCEDRINTFLILILILNGYHDMHAKESFRI